MDLKQMRLFLATATEGNLTRAAERLHMAQPPLTRQIRQIEEALGVTLFVRTPRGMELTEAGIALAEEVPHVLALAQRAEERALRAGSGDLGHLEVGVFGSGMLSAVPELLARFRRSRPEVKMRVHSLTKAEQADALRARRIHIGFHRLPREEDDLSVESVGREPMYVGLPERHPLAQRDEILVQDLADEPMILYPNLPMPGLAQEVMSAFRQENVPLRIEHEVGDVLSCIAMVAAGLGLCVTTESTSRMTLPGVGYRRFRSRHLTHIGLSCMYRRDDRSPVLGAFLSIVRGYASETR